jgi:type VI secretion system protein ImpC
MAEETKAAQPQAAAVTEQEGSLLDQVITETRIGRDAEQREQSRRQIATLVEEVMKGTIRVSKDLEAMINARIADIDQLLSRQLNEVMHAPEFQRLEASWRGLRYLLDHTETGVMLKLKVFNVSKDDLRKDLEKASEFDQSQLFKKVYEEEFGTFGGSPFGVLIGDYEFSRHPQDLSLLEKVAGVANAAHAPFLSAASPELFNWDDFTELSGPRDLAKIFDTPEYAKWKSFRESEESRYVGLCMPHILMRLPYGPDTTPVEAFNFKEDVDGKDHGKYLWGNAAYALGARITDAFAKYGWCAAIRGVEGGGLVEGLPTHTFPTDDGDIAMKCPTEIAITDRREAELAKNGFMPISHYKNTDYGVFIGAQSLQKPAEYEDPDATANANLSARLPYLFAVCRFAHFLKCMVRDKIGSFKERADMQNWLNGWINQYCVDSATSSETQKAQRPLAAAEVVVEDIEGNPGYYSAKFYLRPHYQLEGLTVSLRLVSKLPSAKGGGK